MTINNNNNSIILSTCLFGSVYLFSNSLKLINESILKGKSLVQLHIINGLSFIISGSIFTYCCIKLLNGELTN